MKKLLASIFGVLTVVGIIGMVGGFFWWRSQLAAVTQDSSPQLFTVEEGAALSEVADMLEQAGLIRNATVFTLNQQIKDDTGLKAGTYELNSQDSSAVVFETLSSGVVASQSFTVKSGLTLDELKRSLVEQGLEESDIENAFSLQYGSRVENLATWDDLEGLLLADTYQIDLGQGADQLVRQALAANDAAVLQYETAIARQDLSAAEALILASIIQEEVAGYEDMQRVAGVFLRRLELGISLGSDPTFKYAAAKLGVAETIDIDSPYNTRVYAGLPPGPIATFDAAVLEAIAEPIKTDDLFFVAGDDGVTHFSETLAEHERKAAEYCTTLCQ